MLRLAIAGLPKARVWTDEIDRAVWCEAQGREVPPSFTVDTLERLAKVVGSGVETRLLIGSDQAVAFHRWKHWERVEALAEPLVFVREPDRTREDVVQRLRATGAWNEAQLNAWAGRVVQAEPIEGSATRVREGDRGLLHPAVESYIRERGLYGAGKAQNTRE